MATNELSLKLLIDTKAQKVCFAEVGSDVILFLSSLLCLPVSSIISLRPPVAPTALCPLQQLLDAQLNASTSFFTCEGKEYKFGGYTGTHISCGFFSPIEGSKCPSCSYPMNKKMPHAKTTDEFVVGTTTYTVKDDLSMTPATSVSSITLLAQCGVKDLSTLQEKTVKIGKEEALEILLASLKSKTVLTDVFLQKKKVHCKKEAAA